MTTIRNTATNAARPLTRPRINRSGPRTTPGATARTIDSLKPSPPALPVRNVGLTMPCPRCERPSQVFHAAGPDPQHWPCLKCWLVQAGHRADVDLASELGDLAANGDALEGLELYGGELERFEEVRLEVDRLWAADGVDELLTGDTIGHDNGATEAPTRIVLAPDGPLDLAEVARGLEDCFAMQEQTPKPKRPPGSYVVATFDNSGQACRRARLVEILETGLRQKAATRKARRYNAERSDGVIRARALPVDRLEDLQAQAAGGLPGQKQ